MSDMGMKHLLAGCGKTILARETGGTGETRWKSDLPMSRFSRISRSSRGTAAGALSQHPVMGRWGTDDGLSSPEGVDVRTFVRPRFSRCLRSWMAMVCARLEKVEAFNL